MEIYDFAGAGSNQANSENDFIRFGGFSAGSSIVSIVDSTKQANLAYYTIYDVASDKDFVVGIVSTDGQHLSSKYDFHFY